MSHLHRFVVPLCSVNIQRTGNVLDTNFSLFYWFTPDHKNIRKNYYHYYYNYYSTVTILVLIGHALTASA